MYGIVRVTLYTAWGAKMLAEGLNGRVLEGRFRMITTVSGSLLVSNCGKWWMEKISDISLKNSLSAEYEH